MLRARSRLRASTGLAVWSLNLEFATAAGGLDSRVTFSRTSQATLVDATGRVTYAPNNLLTNSQQFDNVASWSLEGSTLSGGRTAPDGTATAYLFTATAPSGNRRITQVVTQVTGVNYIRSIWIRRVTGTGTILLRNPAGGDTDITSQISSTWSRISVTGTATGASNFILAFTVTGDALEIWGAQLEAVTYQTTPSTYNSTTPKNLLGFTQEFDNAAWTKTNVTIIPNQNPAAATLGSELVTNGDFASGSTGWTDITGAWAVTSGALAGTSVSAGAFGPYSNGVATAGRVYLATFTITVTSGSLLTRVGNTESSGYSVSGTYSQYFVAASSAATIFQVRAGGTGFTGTIDNVSVREVIGGALQAPDGTFTADTLIAAAGTGFIPRVADTSNPTTINAAAYTASMYVKAGTYTFFQIYLNNQSSEWANFTLTGAGTASANGSCTATITALSGGWYRCAMTYTAGGTDRRPFFMMAASGSATRAQTWNPAGTETIFIWGAQLSNSASLDPYVYNPAAAPTSAAYYGPRFDYNPATLAPRGLLIEEQRTNRTLNSEDFTAATWVATVVGTSTRVNDGAPLGFTRGLITATSANGGIRQVHSGLASGQVYALSFYIQSTATSVQIVFENGTSQFGSGHNVTINPSNGTAGVLTGFTSVSIQPFGPGYVYTLITAPAGGALSANIEWRITNSGNSIWLGRPQFEAGAFATSYIPTAASQVTRNADVATMVGANFASWFNGVEGTLLVEATTTAGNARAATLSAGTVTNQIWVQAGAGGELSLQVYTAGAFVAQIGLLPANATKKIAAAYKTNDFAVSIDGGAASTDTSGALGTYDRLNIGTRFDGTAGFLNGHIRSIRYYPARLSNAQLQALTA